MDRYTKGVLTVIAGALVWLCVAQGGAVLPRAEADEARAARAPGRFQLVAAKYTNFLPQGTPDYATVFRLDTETGRVDYFATGQDAKGTPYSTWYVIEK